MKSPPLKLSVLQALIEDGDTSTEDISTLCRTIVQLKDHFSDPASDNDALPAFAMLAAEIISSKGSSLSRANVVTAWKAGKILMKFTLDKLKTEVQEDEGGSVALKRCIGPFTSFCAGTSLIKRDDCDALMSSLRKNVDKFPEGLLIDDDADGEDATSSDATAAADSTVNETLTLAEQTRPQTDLVSHFSGLLTFSRTQAKSGQIFNVMAGMHSIKSI